MQYFGPELLELDVFWHFIGALFENLVHTLQNKGTGELSFLTCFMNFAGSIGKFKYMPNINHYIFNFWIGFFVNITVSQHHFNLNSLAFNTCEVHILNCKIFDMTQVNHILN